MLLSSREGTRNSGGEGHEEGELSVREFGDFFRGVHGCEPFPWQQRLTRHVLERRAWPKVIDLPTGSGKTAVLDTAVFAMAAQPAKSPRRVVFVIDRRIVVDQVYERARRIRDRLEESDIPVLERVRRRLRALSDDEPLGVAALRGGIPIDGEWTHRPDQPWVVVSTVDQFGSRLLFRGYGVTPRMRPVHAGLAGNDCLVILDEVHLSVPFAETLSQVTTLSSDPLPRRFVTVEMSATPSDKTAKRFTLDPATDLDACAEMRRRVNAAKRARLVRVANRGSIPMAVLKIVKSIDRSTGNGDACIRSIGVVVNRVGTARATHDALESAGYRAHLLTGRMRPLDRLVTLERIGPVVTPDGIRDRDGLAVVVATQAIEVGADFSFDAMVSECAPVDSLRQRFGRLDRRGTYSERTGSPAKAWIIGPSSEITAKNPDPIYGDSAKVAWAELERRYGDGTFDVGPLSLRELPDGAVAPREGAPLLLKSHLNAWVQTSPEPLVQPSIGWFLHGINEDRSAEVSVLWRWDRSTEALRLVPPRQAEFIQIPIAAAKSWLAGGAELDIADVAQADRTEDARSSATPHAGDWVRWSGHGIGVEDPIEVRDIRPGDVLVVDPARGGLTAGTWNPASREPVLDLGDAAQVEFGRGATLRLDPRLPYVTSPPVPAGEEREDDPAPERITQWIEGRAGESDDSRDWMQVAIRKLGRDFDMRVVGLDEEEGGAGGYYILTERHRTTKRAVVDASIMDGSDEAGSHTGTGVSLARHLDGVGDRAGGIAERLGMPDEIVADLRFAGRLHDLGKVDPRFQMQLVGGDPVELEMRRGTPLAKSLPGARRSRAYPQGMRHEVASVAMIESNADVLARACDSDLVLHLVGSHHGWGRPLLPIIEDPDPQVLTYTLGGQRLEASSVLANGTLALDMADRFWRLVERYGYYGLAWLETILRLADHQQSAEEARQE